MPLLPCLSPWLVEPNLSPDDTGSPSAVDRDGDGYTSDVDCDDTNPDVYPEAPEICDDLDNDCDAEVDETGTLSYVDADQDGYGDPATEQLICEEDPSRVSNGDDCDDSDPLVNPDAEEICDGIDNDCDSETDAEGLASFTDPNGAVADYSSFVVGSSGSPASLTLSGGRLAVCEGTYFLNIEATGPVEIVGHASESGEVILDAGGVNNVITSVESFVDLNVSGVTLTGGIGWVDPWGDRAGGAMSVHTDGGSGSVVLSDVVISGSSATTGGGLFVWGADTTLTDVEIVGNTATSWTGGAVIADGAATLTRVTIHENHGGYTGGITVFGSTVMNLAQFEDVTLLDNTSDWGASAMFLGSNILDWTASTPGASAVLGNTDLQPSSMYSSAVELSSAEMTVSGVDFGEEGDSTNNVYNDITTGGAAYNAGDGASFTCETLSCGIEDSHAIGGTTDFAPTNPGTVVGQDIQVDSGTAATLHTFSFDYFSGKECSAATVSLLEGSTAQHGKSSNWTVMDSNYATPSEGTVSTYFGYPLRSNGLYAVVLSPICSFSNSTATLGFQYSGSDEDLGFGMVVGTVSGTSSSNTMSLLYKEGAQNSAMTFEATLETVSLD